MGRFLLRQLKLLTCKIRPVYGLKWPVISKNFSGNKKMKFSIKNLTFLILFNSQTELPGTGF